MKRSPLSALEKFVLVFVFALLIFGVIISFINKNWFENVYVVEDGFIEWFTVVPLIITCIICVAYMAKLARRRNWMFSLILIGIALFTFFAAGEEISWGQRIFHIKSSEYFIEHNSQQEMNIHNLIVDDEKVNKIVFTYGLIAGAAVYLIIIPIIYNRNTKFKAFVDKAGLPVARLYQIICCGLVFALPSVSPSSKNPELLEFAGCFMFMLIVAFPQNKYVFRKNNIAK